ncbi:hypothetical protein D9M72_652080 [compost metagenome]
MRSRAVRQAHEQLMQIGPLLRAEACDQIDLHSVQDRCDLLGGCHAALGQKDFNDSPIQW